MEERNDARRALAEAAEDYVRGLEPNGELEVSHADDGTLVISTVRNGWTVSYEFTEDD